jgi:hypothetical protein
LAVPSERAGGEVFLPQQRRRVGRAAQIYAEVEGLVGVGGGGTGCSFTDTAGASGECISFLGV